MVWGSEVQFPSLLQTGPERRESRPCPALPTSFQHSAGCLTQDQTPGQNQASGPNWADVLSLIYLGILGRETSPMCPCPINIFHTGQGGFPPPSPCGCLLHGGMPELAFAMLHLHQAGLCRLVSSPLVMWDDTFSRLRKITFLPLYVGFSHQLILPCLCRAGSVMSPIQGFTTGVQQQSCRDESNHFLPPPPL